MTKNIRHFVICSLVLMLAVLVPMSAYAQMQTAAVSAGWKPANTWVFIVGVLKWPKKANLDAFSSYNRHDVLLRDFFVKKGVPADHVVYIADSEAKLQTIESKLNELLQATAPGDFLFTFYCGHGWVNDGEPYFANYDASDDPARCWSMKAFVDDIGRSFKGSTALITADCCHSGALAEELAQAKPSFRYASLTSAVSDESSTSNWTFTSALLDSLEGHRYADYDSDGVITYSELARYIASEMADLEKQTASASHSNDFNVNLEISHVQFKTEAMPKKVEVLYDKEWYPAKLMEQNAKQAKIHWIDLGWDNAQDDEWVDLNRIRPLTSKTKHPHTISSSPQYEIGTRVKIEWKGDWYPGLIKQYRNGTYFVHYDDYDDSDDEWVEASRISK